jgi:hypothetical protein
LRVGFLGEDQLGDTQSLDHVRDLWLVDATALTGCDGAGVRAIGVAYRRALRHNRRMTLVGAPDVLRRELTRLRLGSHVLGHGDVPPRRPELRSCLTGIARPGRDRGHPGPADGGR